MTAWTVVSLRAATSRQARLLERARRHAEDELAGRTVWCVAALPAGREAATTLRACLDFRTGEGDVAAGCLTVTASEAVTVLGARLDDMLHASRGVRQRLSREDDATYADGCLGAEAMMGDTVAAGDVVVLHDALAAVVAEAARDRGAHVIWRIDAAPSSAARAAIEAWDLMRPHERGVDGYVGEWIEPGAAPGRIGAIVPSRDAVAARDVRASEAPVGWSSALADLVHDDRHETVGGTAHARPAVAIR
jgi:hypothetical protein